MKNLVFDFDGVLADTLETSISARVAIGDHPTRELALEALHHYFDNKPRHVRGGDFDLTHAQKWTERYGTAVKEIGFPMFDHFIEEVLKIKPARIAIVSSGSLIYVKEKALQSGLNPTHVLAFEDHHSKEEKIERICRDWDVSLREIYYFTDSLADVYELENFLDRGKIIGCAWGYSGYEKLRKLLPQEQVLVDWADIHILFK